MWARSTISGVPSIRLPQMEDAATVTDIASTEFGNDKRIGVLEKTLDRQIAWIVGVDRRVGFVFAADVALLGILARVPGKPLSEWTGWSAISGFCIAASLICLAIAMLPTTKGTHLSKLYFGGIADHSADQYEEGMRNLTQSEYLSDLASQCHVNALIANRKYRIVKWSMYAMVPAVVFWSIAMLTTELSSS